MKASVPREPFSGSALDPCRAKRAAASALVRPSTVSPLVVKSSMMPSPSADSGSCDPDNQCRSPSLTGHVVLRAVELVGARPNAGQVTCRDPDRDAHAQPGSM